MRWRMHKSMRRRTVGLEFSYSRTYSWSDFEQRVEFGEWRLPSSYRREDRRPRGCSVSTSRSAQDLLTDRRSVLRHSDLTQSRTESLTLSQIDGVIAHGLAAVFADRKSGSHTPRDRTDSGGFFSTAREAQRDSKCQLRPAAVRVELDRSPQSADGLIEPAQEQIGRPDHKMPGRATRIARIEPYRARYMCLGSFSAAQIDLY